MITVKHIQIQDIPLMLLEDAKKQGVSIATNKKQVLFGAYTEGVLVGFCSLVLFNHGRYGLLKSDYVVPQHRRRGIYRQLNETRLQYAQSIKLPYVLASAYFEAAFLLIKIGGVVEKKYKEGLKIKIPL